MPVSRQSLIDELTALYRDKVIQTPDVRRSVSRSTQNLYWLKKPVHLKPLKPQPHTPPYIEQP